MNLYTTILTAEHPVTRKPTRFFGPDIPAKSWDDAERYCNEHGLGYCKVIGKVDQTKAARSDDAIWRDYDAIQRMYERRAAPVFNSAIRQQIAQAIEYINRYGYETLPAMISQIVTTRPVELAMRRVYLSTCINAAGREYTRLRKEEPIKAVAWEGFRSVWRSFFSDWITTNLGRRIVEITETTRDRIVDVITKHRDSGARDVAKEITDELKSREFTRKRSLVIARTEATTAGNLGHEIGARDWAEEVGVTLYKKWIATADSRTRDSHRTMIAQQPVPVNQKFTVGGELMDRPGDQQASARNVVNCRCRAFYMSERKAQRDYGVVLF